MKFAEIVQRVRRTAPGSAAIVVALACSSGAEPGASEPPGAETSLAQKRSFTPTPCGDDASIPGSFIEACVLAGGSSVDCDGGVAYCCEPCPELGDDCVEHCSQNPEDIGRVALPGGEGPVIDTVDDDAGPPQAPIDAPIVDTLAPQQTPDPASGGTGVAEKPKCSGDGCVYQACFADCQTPERVSDSYCTWYCKCIAFDKKDRFTCERENPYLDLRDDPPPKDPRAEPPPDRVQ
jgi:hypothetical protein